MAARKPTKAMLKALEYVASYGGVPAPRVGQDEHGNYGVRVREDVWIRCHEEGWLVGRGSSASWDISELTSSGWALLGKEPPVEVAR